jgi:hypothetical protein
MVWQRSAGQKRPDLAEKHRAEMPRPVLPAKNRRISARHFCTKILPLKLPVRSGCLPAVKTTAEKFRSQKKKLRLDISNQSSRRFFF